MQPLPFAVFLVSTMIFVAADRRRESINLSKVPPGPYSLAVYARDVMHVSGLHVSNISHLTFGQETRLILNNMKQLLESRQLTLGHVAKTTVFLTNWDNYDEMNKIYREYFTEKFPARSTLQVVRLPRGSRVAIEAVAVRSEL